MIYLGFICFTTQKPAMLTGACRSQHVIVNQVPTVVSCPEQQLITAFLEFMSYLTDHIALLIFKNIISIIIIN